MCVEGNSHHLQRCLHQALVLSKKFSSVVFKIMLKNVVNVDMYFVEGLKGID